MVFHRLMTVRNPDDRFGEGFRMPARRDLSTPGEGRRPKASQEGTRGPLGWASAVYGDLRGRRLGSEVRWLVESTADRRSR